MDETPEEVVAQRKLRHVFSWDGAMQFYYSARVAGTTDPSSILWAQVKEVVFEFTDEYGSRTSEWTEPVRTDLRVALSEIALTMGYPVL